MACGASLPRSPRGYGRGWRAWSGGGAAARSVAVRMFQAARATSDAADVHGERKLQDRRVREVRHPCRAGRGGGVAEVAAVVEVAGPRVRWDGRRQILAGGPTLRGRQDPAGSAGADWGVGPTGGVRLVRQPNRAAGAGAGQSESVPGG